jgi:cyclic 2,3-diphosphoglycerate synthetase
VVIDGEHYPPVIEQAIAGLMADGNEVAAAVLVGGKEKLPAEGLDVVGTVPVLSGGSPTELLARAIREIAPQAVMDLSDEPVLDYRQRFALASVALRLDVPYHGADFEFVPPARPRLAEKPSVAIIGTGKRTGKTAVAGHAARTLVANGRRPAVVAMGRGGPAEPEVLRGDRVELTPHDLLALAEAGKHAASDYVEDAYLARVPTVGCRRCGGGLAGAVGTSNVERGVELANSLDVEMLLLEGSGSAIPPVHADVTVLVVPVGIPEEYLVGYLGHYRLLLADLVVVTMCEEPFGSPSQISSLESLHSDLRRTLGDRSAGSGGTGLRQVPPPQIQMVRTVFRPSPTRSVSGAKAYVTTTAPEEAGDSIRRHLEEKHGCEVVGISHHLSDRKRLTEDLEGVGEQAEVLLCEIKAAAIDVATRWGLDAGLEVVYMDNVPMGISGDDLDAAVIWAAEAATARFEEGDR